MIKQLSFVLFFGALSSSVTAMDFATHGAQMLEKLYVNDCTADTKPHGYYGAFLQPCEFSFFQQQAMAPTGAAKSNVCLDETSTLVAKPVPMHWFFNLTDHMEKDDWDDIDFDDQDWSQIADELMLWPDQCVGVTPRCYSVEDSAIHDTLHRLFDEIPVGATHVQVNCQADALELSRVTYAFADGFERSMPTIIAWMTMVILFSVVALAWCGYACFRLCRNTQPTYVVATAVDDKTSFKYAAVEDGTYSGEKAKLVH